MTVDLVNIQCLSASLYMMTAQRSRMQVCYLKKYLRPNLYTVLTYLTLILQSRPMKS